MESNERVYLLILVLIIVHHKEVINIEMNNIISIGLWLLLLIWIVSGILSYGYLLAWYQKRWPLLAHRGYREDVSLCLLYGLFGPISLLMVWITRAYRYGLMFR